MRQPSLFSQVRLLNRNYGSAIRFTGSGLGNVTLHSFTNPTTAISVGTWVTVQQFKNWINVIQRDSWSTTGKNSWLLFIDVNGKVNWGVSNGTAQTTLLSPIALNKKFHMIGTYDGVTLTLYINGQPVASKQVTITFDALTSLKILDNSSNIMVDESFLYNRSLSPQEAQDIYIGKPLPLNGLQFYYSYDEGAGTTTVDKSGNGNTLTGLPSNAWVSSFVMAHRSITSRRTPSTNRQRLIKPNRVNPMGSSCHLDGLNNTNLNRQLQLMQAIGVKWVRFDFTMSSIEPTQGSFNWTNYDTIVTTASSYGIEVIALVDQYNIPGWANGNQASNVPPSPSIYQAFCQAIATRYLGQIHLFEMGNEPNISQFWQPTPDPAAYTALLQAGYNGIKLANPNAKVISAGLTPTGSPNDPVTFLTNMYGSGAKGYFDFFGIHPYSRPVGPDAGFILLDKCLQIMQMSGDGNKPMIISEVGWPTSTDSLGVSQQIQGSFIGESFQKILYGKYQNALILCIYDFKDDGTDITNPENNYGLVDTNLFPKPSYTTFGQMSKHFASDFIPINPY